MRITVPDAVADALEAQLPNDARLDQEIARRLQLVRHLPVGETGLVLTQAQLSELAQHLGRQTSLRSYTDILAAVDRLAALSFGHLRFDFSAGQLEEMERRAARESLPAAEYAARVLRNLTQQFFTTQPAREEWPQLQADPGALALGALGIVDEDPAAVEL